MNQVKTTPAAEPSLTRQIAALLKHWFRGRRGWIAMALLVLGTVAYLNWSWLVAAGTAPILVALAPCAAMSALGSCMKGGAGNSCNATGETESAGRSLGDAGAAGPAGGADAASEINPRSQRTENHDA